MAIWPRAWRKVLIGFSTALGLCILAEPGAAQSEAPPTLAETPADGAQSPPATDATEPVETAAAPLEPPGQPVTIDACVDAHAKSQKLRKDLQLLESREKLLLCSMVGCPGAIRKDCASWLEDMQTQIPKVSFRATIDGETTSEIQVYLDGELLLEHLDGKAIELNPGTYKLRFVAPGELEPLEQSLIMSEGERFRTITAMFKTPEQPKPKPVPPPIVMTRPIPTLVYVFAGVGTAAAISGTAWGLSSWAVEGELEASCAPDCDEKTVDVARRRALIADVSWGVSAASFITAGALFLMRPEVPSRADPELDVAILPGGALIRTAIDLPTF